MQNKLKENIENKILYSKLSKFNKKINKNIIEKKIFSKQKQK